MVKQRQKIQYELDEISRKIEEILLELRMKADTFSSEEGEERIQKIEFLSKVYGENEKIPTWPFDWNIILKFAAAQAVPILSLIGAGDPILKIISILTTLLNSQ